MEHESGLHCFSRYIGHWDSESCTHSHMMVPEREGSPHNFSKIIYTILPPLLDRIDDKFTKNNRSEDFLAGRKTESFSIECADIALSEMKKIFDIIFYFFTEGLPFHREIFSGMSIIVTESKGMKSLIESLFGTDSLEKFFLISSNNIIYPLFCEKYSTLYEGLLSCFRIFAWCDISCLSEGSDKFRYLILPQEKMKGRILFHKGSDRIFHECHIVSFLGLGNFLIE